MYVSLSLLRVCCFQGYFRNPMNLSLYTSLVNPYTTKVTINLNNNNDNKKKASSDHSSQIFLKFSVVSQYIWDNSQFLTIISTVPYDLYCTFFINCISWFFSSILVCSNYILNPRKYKLFSSPWICTSSLLYYKCLFASFGLT